MAGGLATTSTVIRADFWRLGQCRPGDSLRFKRVSWESARILRERTEAYLASARAYIEGSGEEPKLVDTLLPENWTETILHRISDPMEVVFRQSGDSYIHVTYGSMTASALTRAHIQHRLEELKKDNDIIAVIGTTRGKKTAFKANSSVQCAVRCLGPLSKGSARTTRRSRAQAGHSTSPHPWSTFQVSVAFGRPVGQTSYRRVHGQASKFCRLPARQHDIHCQC